MTLRHNIAGGPARSTVAGERVTAAPILRALGTHSFGVLSSVDEEGRPRSAGVNYGVSAPGVDLAIYVMTRRHLQKTRNIPRNPQIALVVPLRRRLLGLLPPATIQLFQRVLAAADDVVPRAGGNTKHLAFRSRRSAHAGRIRGVESPGMATLTGPVSSHQKAEAAADFAVAIASVRDVANRLAVQGDGRERDDTTIARTIRHAFGWNAAVPSEAIDTIICRGS